jgi:hypothetical protein
VLARQAAAAAAGRTSVFEPCVGDGAIVRELVWAGYSQGHTNDLEPAIAADYHFDAADPWPDHQQNKYNWIVTNPPFAMPKNGKPLPVNILKHALAAVRPGGAVSLLLRVTFLEPCENRGLFLQEHPPAQIIVLPRYSFTQNGKSDSATCAWMTWIAGDGAQYWSRRGIVVANDAESL